MAATAIVKLTKANSPISFKFCNNSISTSTNSSSYQQTSAGAGGGDDANLGIYVGYSALFDRIKSILLERYPGISKNLLRHMTNNIACELFIMHAVTSDYLIQCAMKDMTDPVLINKATDIMNAFGDGDDGSGRFVLPPEAPKYFPLIEVFGGCGGANSGGSVFFKNAGEGGGGGGGSGAIFKSNAAIMPNADIMDTLRDGSPADIESLPHMCIANPMAFKAHEHAVEQRFAVEAAFYMVNYLGVSTLAGLYKRIGALADRMCVGCPVPRRRFGCVPGSWRCVKCTATGSGGVSFLVGMREWVENGSPVRHAAMQ